MANRTDQHPRPHDPRSCNLCTVLRHPAQAKQGRALTKHLVERPLPVQQTGAGR